MPTKTRKYKNKKYKRTYKKSRGGFKTLNEIIDNLKKKGKYDEWVSKGSSFTYRWPNANLNFTFINSSGNQIKGAYQGTNFRNNVESIPIFGQIFVNDPSHVHQGNFRIVSSLDPLSTEGLATCSGLAMRIGNKKFLTHLDARTSLEPIIKALKETITEEDKSPTDVIIYAGGGLGNATSEVTVKMAKEICNALNIPDSKIHIEKTCFMSKVTY
jgi:hypothetical protein